mgnify:CR=1 FL=1|tara:strand:+ start:10510 stop:12030 length:1521 start_codon:yes stop_codon:yes gene_type:complete
MKIYQQEINDGLEKALSANNTIACCALAESYNPTEKDIENLKKALDSSEAGSELAIAENQDQFDLYYLKSILVSTGWNKNDDVFDPKEMWEARNTPEDKPFNFMHDEKDIIGHITANEVVDFEGKVVDEQDGLPSQFNIVTSAVIYTEWSDAEQRERMKKITAEIEEGKWFVSMECLFPEFDYALANKDGETKIVKRNEASAFLTKHLRSYGGDGIYEDYRVGRLLRNLSFSGKGLVSKPANPRSVILEGNDLFDESKAQVLTISSLKENDMSESYEKQITDLQSQLAESKAANKALEDKIVAEQQAEFDAKLTNLEETIAEQSTKIAEQEEAYKVLAEQVTKHEATIAEKEEAIASKQEELDVLYKKEAVMKRVAQLTEAGFDAEEATATVEKFESVNDEIFAEVVALAAVKKKAEMKKDEAKPFPPKKDEDKDEEKDAEAKPMKKMAELDEERDVAEVDEEALAQAEETEEVAIAEAMGEDDPAENLRSVASEWLGSVLQSNNK